MELRRRYNEILEQPVVQKTVHYGRVIAADINRVDLTRLASAMAYITLFSLVPSLAAFFTVIGLFLPIFGDNAYLLDELKELILHYLATGSGEQVVGYLEQFLAGMDLKKIGYAAFTGVLISFVLLLRQVEEAFNRIWMVHRGRNPITRFVFFWTFLTLGIFLLAIIVGLTADFSFIENFFGRTGTLSDTLEKGGFFGHLITWGSEILFAFFLYKIIPNCDVRWKSALYGALVGGTLFYVASSTYGIYVRDFNNYRSIYGTLAAVPLFLLWLYVVWIIVLLGALFSWRTQAGWPANLGNMQEEKTAHDPLLQAQIRSLLPLVLLVLVHERFAKGKGLSSADDLGAKLSLPLDWVDEALRLLEDWGLIAEARPEASPITLMIQANLAKKWLPTCPAEAVSLPKLWEKYSFPLTDWLGTCQYLSGFGQGRVSKILGELNRQVGSGSFSLPDLLRRV